MIKRSITILFFLFSVLSYAQQAMDVFLNEKALITPQEFKGTYDRSFSYNEIPVFNKDDYENAVVLENGYADYHIKNPNDWREKTDAIAYEIDIVFTKYPWKKSDWLTNYYDLLSKRLRELFILDPGLNNKDIKWNLVLQTDCKTDEETRTFFHGIVIKYYMQGGVRPDVSDTESIRSDYSFEEAEKYSLKVGAWVDYYGGAKDYVVYKVLKRIEVEEDCLVVMDWTASMYTYAAQAIIWHLKHFQTSGITQFTFFNDGDFKTDYQKSIGNTGGIYHVESDQIDTLLKTMDVVMENGMGGDWPENDIEAILAAIEENPNIKQIILIADNNSNMRDYELIKDLNIPVHIILCGVSRLINVQYLNLAYQTGGSIHTETDDFYNIAEELDEENGFYLLQHKYLVDSDDNIKIKMDYDRFWFEEQVKKSKSRNKSQKEKRRKMPRCPEF